MFMAPEQAAGRMQEIGTASDVYALGVVLYRLTDGAWPFDETLPPLQLLAAARDSEPRRPRGLDRDLTAIVLKALAKEKSERYASVHTFSEDLARYLAGEPVAARAPSLSYFLRKRLRKHWRAAAATATALAVIATFAVAYIQERRRAAERNARALHQAKELINTIVFDLHERLEPLGMTDVLAEVTDRAARFPWDLESNANGQLDLRRFQALAATVRGDVFTARNQRVEATAEYRLAAALLDELVRQYPQHRGLLAENVAAHLAVNRMLDQAGNHEEALRRSRELLAMLEGSGGGPAAELIPPRIEVHRACATLLTGMGRFAEARGEIEAALALADTSDAAARSEAFRAELHAARGEVCFALAQIEDARDAHTRAEKLCRSALAQNGGNRPARDVLSRSLAGAAAAALAKGDLDSAGATLREAASIREQLHRESAVAPISPHDMALIHRCEELGRAQLARGEDAPAAEALDAASGLLFTIFPHSVDRVPLRIQHCGILRAAAGAHLRLGHHAEAARDYHEALRHAKEVKKRSPDETEWLLTILDCHVHLLHLPPIPRGPRDDERKAVLAQGFRTLDGAANLTDAQRSSVEDLRTRLAAVPPR
jgi:tetratricopeptide (TPR) repeat protein